MKSAKWPFLAINSSYFPTSDMVPLLITAMMSTCGKYVMPCVTRILVYQDKVDISYNCVRLIFVTGIKVRDTEIVLTFLMTLRT